MAHCYVSYAQVRSGSDRSLIAAAFKGHVGVARVLLRNGEIKLPLEGCIYWLRYNSITLV